MRVGSKIETKFRTFRLAVGHTGFNRKWILKIQQSLRFCNASTYEISRQPGTAAKLLMILPIVSPVFQREKNL